MQRTFTNTFFIALFVFVMACTQQGNQQSQQENSVN